MSPISRDSEPLWPLPWELSPGRSGDRRGAQRLTATPRRRRRPWKGGQRPLPRLTGHEGPPRGSGQTAGSLRAGRRGAGRASSAEPVDSSCFSGGHRPCTSHHPHRSHAFAPGGVMAPDEGGNGTAPRFREAATKWGMGDLFGGNSARRQKRIHSKPQMQASLSVCPGAASTSATE